MKAVIYARCSSSGSLEARQDTTRQVRDLESYCKYSNYEVVRVFEEHMTAKNGINRPVLNECIAFCKEHKVDLLGVSELSRINRGSVFETMTFVKDLMDAHINLFAQKEQFTLLDADGAPSIYAPVLLSCLSLAYSLELDSLKFRLNSGRQQAISRGVKMGRKVGSVESREKKMEKHADVIRYLKKGVSIRDTAKLCNVGVSTVQRIKRLFNI